MDDESLGWVVFDGDTAGLRAMLLSGADPNVVDDGTPLVELAVRFGRIGVLRILAEFGATLDVPSLLHNVVAGRELPDMLLVLLELGADVTPVTPLAGRRFISPRLMDTRARPVRSSMPVRTSPRSHVKDSPQLR
nr:hypothetical protein [Herbidospora cretacea]